MTENSSYKRDIFVEQYPLVDLFVKHLIHYRAVTSAMGNREFSSPFWGDTANAHLLQASIFWCMIFGSQGPNKTHWKKMLPEADKDLHALFRQSLCKHIGFSEAEWEAYWKQMTAFRDGYAAHRDISNPKPIVPKLDTALEVAYFYDHWVRQLIYPDILAERPLKEDVTTLSKSVTAEVEAAMSALSP